jgi:hypothetical protein
MKMKHKVILLSYTLILSFGIILQVLGQTNKNPNTTINLSDFVSQHRQLLNQQRQTQIEQIKEVNTPPVTTSNAPQNIAPLSYCDCDNMQDPNNYPKNFIYDDQNHKITRIQPVCQCITKLPSTSENPKETNENYELNIHY